MQFILETILITVLKTEMVCWASVKYVVLILLMISYYIHNLIYTKEVSIPRVYLKNMEKKYSSNYQMPGEIRFMAVYEHYMYLRRENKAFNVKLGENKNLFDIVMKYQKSSIENINKLEQLYDASLKKSDVHMYYSSLINSIALTLNCFVYLI